MNVIVVAEPTIIVPNDIPPVVITVEDKNVLLVQDGPRGASGPAGVGVPAGGNTGMHLIKVSPSDYHTEWSNPPAPPAGNDKAVQYNDGGVMGGDDNLRFDKNTKSLILGIPDALPDNPLGIGRSVDGWLQANINNVNEGAKASSDWVATADNGSDLSNYVDMGIDSSIYESEDYPFYGPNDAYIQAEAPRLMLNPIRLGSSIEFVTGGSELTDHRATIDDEGLTMAPGHVIKHGATGQPVPQIYYGTGEPPSAVGLPDGTMFFKYA